MKHPVVPLLVLVATLAACDDAGTAVRSPDADAARLRAAATEGATLALEDAASRVAPALDDAAVGAALASSLEAVATAMRAGDAPAALRASRSARLTLAAYTAHDDASDRDVISLALDGADRTLVPSATVP